MSDGKVTPVGPVPTAQQVVEAWRNPASARQLPLDVQRQLLPNPAGHAPVSGAVHRTALDVHEPAGYTVTCYSSKCYSSTCYSSSCYSSKCYSTNCYTGQNKCGYHTQKCVRSAGT